MNASFHVRRPLPIPAAMGRQTVPPQRHLISPCTSIDGLAHRFRCRSITPVSDERGRIGIDVGGTFTDAVIVVDDGHVRIAKVRSTPERIEAGFMDGLRQLLERAGAEAADVGYLAHGSTVATNAIVQRRLARTALITNEGFRDVLEIGTQMRAHVYDLWTPEPEPIVPRDLCLGVRGRIDAAGEEVEPLDADSVRAAAAALRDRGVEAVAGVLLFSFINHDHERRGGGVPAGGPPRGRAVLSARVGA